MMMSIATPQIKSNCQNDEALTSDSSGPREKYAMAVVGILSRWRTKRTW